MSVVTETSNSQGESPQGPILNPLQEMLHFFRFPSKTNSPEKAKLYWLVKLRWMAIGLFLALSGPALVFGLLKRSTVPTFLGILSVLIVFNFLTQLVLSESQTKIGSVAVCFQLAFDLLVLTVLLSFSGGFENPFTLLFLLNASLGGLLIPGRLSWPFLLITHFLLGTLQFQFAIRQDVALNSGLIATFAVYHFLVLGFWIVMRSLGAYLEQQNELQSQSRLAFEKRDRLRSIGALAAGFSHEFASPLNAAKIRLERLARHQNSEDVSEALSAILSCQNVIEQMNSSQLDSRSFHFKSVILGDLLRDVVDSWAEENSSGCQLSLHIEPALRCSVPPVNFAQVALNLLDNASDANPGGKITVSLEANGNEVEFSVADEGDGFAPHILRQRGEPFVTTKPHGTGLGLYVSELFAQSLGGRMELRNQQPRGASVSIRWPSRENEV